ncbi:MAG: flagellar biosynthetic protein FliO [Spirochaetia bacterium]|nr:flagellar biosynthetic protein FliO [Spirochaetia bacterium]
MTKQIRVSCAFILFVSIVGATFAQGTAAPEVDETTLVLPDAPQAGTPSQGSSILPYVLRMVLVLGLVIAAIYGLYALIKRSAKPSDTFDSYLRILATSKLGVGRSLHVVSLGEKAWLIGSTDTAVGLIAEIDDKELIDALALRASEAPHTPRRDFGSILGELLGRKGSKSTASVSNDFFNRQKDRLKKF